MVTRATRWFSIAAPVVAGILVLILGTAGSISTTFGVVLIGLGPIIWMWNWLIRMSLDDERDDEPPARAPARRELRPPVQVKHHPGTAVPRRPPRELGVPRRRRP